MAALITLLISVITGFIGALIGHLMAERKSRRDELASMRLVAYSDFLKATSAIVSARRRGQTEDTLIELGHLNDAKARVCICAPESVVSALEEFWLHGGTLEGEREIVSFTRLCQSMRASLGNDRLHYEIRLSDILFRLEPSSYSYKVEKAGG
jgi:hypothetical protein